MCLTLVATHCFGPALDNRHMGRDAVLMRAAFLHRCAHNKGLSRSPFNRLHCRIIAKFFLRFPLVRTSRAATSAALQSERQSDPAVSDKVWCERRERNTGLEEFEFLRKTRNSVQKKREK